MDETLDYVLFLTRRVPPGDVSSAILLLLCDLNFQVKLDSFDIIRNAIMLKTKHPGMQMGDIYQKLEEICISKPNYFTCEQAIRSCIVRAWKERREEKWILIFPDCVKNKKYPGNKEFIAQLGCIMELWLRCKEGSVHAE